MSLITARNFILNSQVKNVGQIKLLSNARDFSSSNESEYIQNSKLPTMHFQDSLLRLPIPKLEDTCKRYLNAQRPLLSDNMYNRTSAVVDQFLKEQGPQLQKELHDIDKKNRHTSYITEYWFDMYLRDRKPLPINYNPILVFIPEEDKRYNQPVVKATNLIVSSLRFMKSLRAGILEPEVFHLNPKKTNTPFFKNFTRMLPRFCSAYGAYLMKAYPLDMSQYNNLFNGTRIPEMGKDRIFHDKSARHVVVMKGGHFYAFDVLDKNNCIRNPKEIASCLNKIFNDKTPKSEHPLGVFTASNRDDWAQYRKRLTKLRNGDIFRKIDSAVFVLCLDDETIGEDKNALLRMFLHGDGVNRWFDKSFSLILSKDGVAGVNFEHSWGDGVAVLRYFQDVKADISKKPQFHPEELSSLSSDLPVEKLEFNLDDSTKRDIAKELKMYRDWTDRLGIDFYIYEGFGKKHCKGLNVTPDAFMQLGFQIAFFKDEKRTVGTYESCSTAAFKHGRTETMRPVTSESKELCMAMTQTNRPSKEELGKMIRTCSTVHYELVKNASMGQGFDRHLFALRKLNEDAKKRELPIFTDESYAFINHNILSTSTLSSPAVMAGGFGPVVQDGYGIGYMIQDEKLGVVVTTYKDFRDGNRYVQNLKETFQDLQLIVQSTK